MFEQLTQDRELRTWKAPLAATAPAQAPAGLNGLLMRMLDEIDYGLLLVAADGQLRYANQLGLKEVLDNGALQLLHGRIQARGAADQGALLAALADARRGLRRLFNAMHAGAPVSVAVVPMGHTPGDGGEPMALLVFGKRQASETLTLDFYARTQGLTAAEAAVLKGMCGGLKPKEVARQQGVAISTVRSHICSIRIKTNTGSIRELLNRVAVLPPITSAVKNFSLPVGGLGVPVFTH
jgi:DNA-binding CsgD family transcriptional regulator